MAVPARIRRVRPDEWREFRELRLRSLVDAPDAFASTHEREAAYPDEEWREWTRDGAAGDGMVTFVAGGFVGTASGYVVEESRAEVRLFAMWVAPDARGAGLGAALVEAVVDWARARGSRRVSLWVTEANEAARALYERTGFTATEERKRVRENDEVLMIRELD